MSAASPTSSPSQSPRHTAAAAPAPAPAAATDRKSNRHTTMPRSFTAGAAGGGGGSGSSTRPGSIALTERISAETTHARHARAIHGTDGDDDDGAAADTTQLNRNGRPGALLPAAEAAALQKRITAAQQTTGLFSLFTRTREGDEQVRVNDFLMDPKFGEVASTMNGMQRQLLSQFSTLAENLNAIWDKVKNIAAPSASAAATDSKATALDSLQTAVTTRFDTTDRNIALLLGRDPVDTKTDTARHTELLDRFTAEGKADDGRQTALIARFDADAKVDTTRHTELLDRLTADGKTAETRHNAVLDRFTADDKAAETRHTTVIGRFAAIDARGTREMEELRRSNSRWRCCAITTMLTSAVALPLIYLWNAPQAAYNGVCDIAFQVCKTGSNLIGNSVRAMHSGSHGDQSS